MSIVFNKDHLKGFISQKDLEKVWDQVLTCHNCLEEKTGAGSEYTGWTHLPSSIDEMMLDDLVKLGEDVRSRSQNVVSIGIGGSYLGIRATLDFLRWDKFPIHFAGHNISAEYHHKLLESIQDEDTTIVVISKSGTTTEPALAFRLLKKFLSEKYSEEQIKERVICVTDEKKGALRQIADESGYRTYVIPDDVGGRFSVLTPVGLVPLALAGVDIKALVAGAQEGEKLYSQTDLEINLSYQYAAVRYLLYKMGKEIEVKSSFYDNLQYVAEWWKQLYGESEAKNGRGIFPSSLMMSTDLHSMGQLMQDGARNMFETFIDIEEMAVDLSIPEDQNDFDKFNIVAGKDLDYVNCQAYKATASAHFEGGVPNTTIQLSKADEYHLGQLYYFYQRGVAISGYLLGVNPFNQPGVEAYKKKMFALLGRK